MHWRKSSRSASGSQCVEIGYIQNVIYARDSKNPTGPTLSYSHAGWTAFLTATKGNDLKLG
ncbi:MAG: DUF397 domain-containing protein [Candidatus Dormibacteraceae bacterium]